MESTPRQCRACGAAWDSLNGRWCPLVKRYVTHDKTPPCGNDKPDGELRLGPTTCDKNKDD